MKGLFRYLVLPALIAGLLANVKDIRRYLRMRSV